MNEDTYPNSPIWNELSPEEKLKFVNALHDRRESLFEESVRKKQRKASVRKRKKKTLKFKDPQVQKLYDMMTREQRKLIG